MKKTQWVWCLAVWLSWGSPIYASPKKDPQGGLAKPAVSANIDYNSYIDANKILMFVTNMGSFAYDNTAMFGRADGLYYPRGGDSTLIYAGGLWLGARVSGDLRVSVAEYTHTYWPGPMVNGTFVTDANTKNEYRVYKIFRDLAFNGFYAGSRPSNPDSARLWDDYRQWPVAQGAPVDEWGEPRFIGDQTLWCVYNDANPAARNNSTASSHGLGVEIQQTTFAITQHLGEVVFIRYVITNKGHDFLSNMYVGPWADPDVGTADNDFAGCYGPLDLGFAYSATRLDSIYGTNPPAVGYCLLQGPAVPASYYDSAYVMGDWRRNYRNLPMTSFTKYANGTDPTGPEQAYWYMQGLWPDGSIIVDPTTEQPTSFMFSGDPVAGTGWLDRTFAVVQHLNIGILEVAGPGDVPLNPPYNVAYTWNSTNEWYVSSDRRDNFDRLNFNGLIGTDTWEFRFTAAGSEYYNWNTEEKFANRAPFEAYNLGSEKPNDPANDRRIQIAVRDDDTSGGWSPGDWIYLSERAYHDPQPDTMEYTWPDDFHIGRITFNGGVPQQGTRVQFISRGLGDPDTILGPDCRYMLSSGPFEMAPGDRQEVVMAVVVGRGTDRLSSITRLRQNAAAARNAWYCFNGDCNPPSVTVPEQIIPQSTSSVRINLNDYVTVQGYDKNSLRWWSGSVAGNFNVSTAGSQATIAVKNINEPRADHVGFIATDVYGAEGIAIVPVRTRSSSVTIADDVPGNRYRMISLPVQPDDDRRSAVLEELTGTPDYDWRIARWDPAQKAYDFNITALEPGYAYWVISTQNKALRMAGTAVLPSVANSRIPFLTGYPIPIKPGWNQIGIPCAYPVDFFDSYVQRGTTAIDYSAITDAECPVRAGLYHWDGSGYDDLFLGPSVAMAVGDGYWVYVDEPCDDCMIWLPAKELTSGQAAKPAALRTSNAEWSVRITATCRDLYDRANFFGIRAEATDEHDRLDLPEPPVWSPGISVSFEGGFTTDYRRTCDSATQWRFSVHTELEGEVVLEFALDSFPDGESALLLTDLNSGQQLVLNQHSEYRYHMADQERFFRISLTTKRDIQTEASGSPPRYFLYANYPNPFNAQTVIAYELGESAEVTLEILDILGRRVQVLTQSRQLAGKHDVTWDGKDDSNRPAGSGVYFCRLTAGVFTQVQKIVLMR